MSRSDLIDFRLFDKDVHLELVEPLTILLHKAYAPLAAKGMKYLATHQPPSKTLERLSQGESYLAFYMDKLIGTFTLYPERPTSSCEYYRKPGVYVFGHFAIDPSEQGKGFGSQVMDFLDNRAKAVGARELALDTSEHAENLIKMYEKRGYNIVAHAQWEVTNYRSVIMTKIL